jgi:hypothetical protein
MRNIRNILLALIVSIAGVIPATSVSASVPDVGGVSESSSEPRSTTLPSTPTKWKTVTFKMGPTIKYWQKVAQCETGGDWQDKGNWGGGLGIAQSAWNAYGGTEFAKHPSEATVLEQIVIANRIAVFGFQTKRTFVNLTDKEANKPFFRHPVGFTGWGCIKNNKYLRPTNDSVYTAKLPVGKQFYCPQYEATFKKYALPYKVFSYIAWRESRCNPGAVNATWENGQLVWTLNKNGSYDSGLLQINSSWFKTLREQFGHDPQDLFNPEVNALFASWILHFSSGRLSNWNIKAKV